MTKGVVYYTDGELDPVIAGACQRQLRRAAEGLHIVSVSLRPTTFADDNITLGLKRGYLSMFQQILTGVSHCDEDIIFFAEHDVLYDRSHFEFTPKRDDVVHYNQNVWRLRADTGEALFHYHNSVSQLCANRRTLIDHYRERIARVEAEGFKYKMGFEPGTRKRDHGGIDDLRSDTWMSEVPNIDIHTGKNLTRLLWEKSDFRNQKFTAGWTKSDSVPGWPNVTLGRFRDWLTEIVAGTASSV